jgi:hypothetical protein
MICLKKEVRTILRNYITSDGNTFQHSNIETRMECSSDFNI